jgi:alkylhydroperoxidase family enzyme
MAHVADEEPPPGVYSESEAAIVRFSRRLTRMEPIDDPLYAELERHFSQTQLIELTFYVGLNNLVSRFHATFHTDLDAAMSGQVASACPVPLPQLP